MRRLHRHRHRAAADGGTATCSTSATTSCAARPIRSRQNTRRYIEEHTGRTFGEDEWTKIALTEQQVKARPRLKRLSITQSSTTATSQPRRYEAIECEALGQGVLVRLIRKHLDSLLPDEFAVVQEREQEQRTKVSDELAKIAG